jgi:CO/xanthine dehydrogenase Mo-binding subunit
MTGPSWRCRQRPICPIPCGRVSDPGNHFEDNTRIPHLYAPRKVIKVNKGPNTAVRCEQLPNTMSFTLVFDRVAAELGMDPIDVAIKNDGAKGHDMAWLTEQKEEVGFTPRDSLKECLEKGKTRRRLGQ